MKYFLKTRRKTKKQKLKPNHLSGEAKNLRQRNIEGRYTGKGEVHFSERRGAGLSKYSIFI